MAETETRTLQLGICLPNGEMHSVFDIADTAAVSGWTMRLTEDIEALVREAVERYGVHENTYQPVIVHRYRVVSHTNWRVGVSGPTPAAA